MGPNNLVLWFFKLGLDLGGHDLGPVGSGDWDLDLGLTINAVFTLRLWPKYMHFICKGGSDIEVLSQI